MMNLKRCVICRISEFLVIDPIPPGIVETPLTGATLATLLASNTGNDVLRFGRNGGMNRHRYLVRKPQPRIGCRC